jgi:hypothetical protein
MLIALKFEILRQVTSNGTHRIPMQSKPVRVGTLIDESAFLNTGGGLTHNKSVFLEEQFHDWMWSDGYFTYYSRVAEIADVVIAYEVVDRVECRHCSTTYDKIDRKTPCTGCGQ